MFLISELSVLCPSSVTFQKEKSNPINAWPAFPLEMKSERNAALFFSFFLNFQRHWLKNAGKIVTTWRTGKDRISTVFFTYISTAVVLSYWQSRAAKETPLPFTNPKSSLKVVQFVGRCITYCSLNYMCCHSTISLLDTGHSIKLSQGTIVANV